MNRLLSLFGLVVGLTAGGPGQAAFDAATVGRLSQPLVPGGIDEGLFSAAVLIYANAARAAHGLAPLAPDRRLAAAADIHAGNMARLRMFGHSLPVRGQATFQQRIDGLFPRYRIAGENIAMYKLYRLLGRPISMRYEGCAFTYGDDNSAVPIHSYASLASDVVDRWMRSPGHRANLLSPYFLWIGSALAIDPEGSACGDVYVVQDFAG